MTWNGVTNEIVMNDNSNDVNGGSNKYDNANQW